MKNKKILFIGLGLLVLIVAATVTTILVLNKDSGCEEHTFGSWNTTVQATCLTEGKKERTCTVCEHKEEEVVPALGHTGGTTTCTEKSVCIRCNTPYGDEPTHNFGEYVEVLKATCETTGKEERTCTKCGLKEEQIIEALDHNYQSSVIEPGCLTSGYTQHVCTNEGCNSTYVSDRKTPLGHSWDKEIECESGHTCTVCHITEDACGHNYVLINHKDASCLTAESNTYKCNTCNDKYMETIGLPLGHDLAGVEGLEELVSGCEYKLMYECNDCGEAIEGEHIHKHEYVASIQEYATCVSNGVKLLTCKHCSATDTEPIEKNEHSHNWNDGVLVGNIRTYECLNLGCSNTKTVVDASSSTVADVLASDLQNAGGIQLQNSSIQLDESTLSQMAGKDLTISSETLNEDELNDVLNGLTPEQQEQLGENPTIYNFMIQEAGSAISEFDGFVTVTLPYTLGVDEDINSIAVWYMNGDTPEAIEAVYSEGFITFKTNHFSFYTVTRLTPRERCETYGHQWVVTEVEGTCTRDGYKTSFCQCCHETVKDVTTVAPGHDYQELSKQPATCLTNGLLVVKCNNCDHQYEQRINATGHNLEVLEQKDATCTEDGLTKYRCSECDYTSTSGIIEAFGHNYVPTWTWADDHSSATVKFVCKNDDEHVQEYNVAATITETLATCVLEGKKEYTVSIIFETETYTDKFEEVLPIIDHNYVDGTCSMCQRTDGKCYHETFHEEVLILDNLGTCPGILAYTTCDCGEVKHPNIPGEVLYDMSPYVLFSGLGCLQHLIEIEQNSEETDTGETNYMKSACSECGLVIEIEATMEIENCYYTGSALIRYSFNGETLLEYLFEYNDSEKEHDYDHETVEYINLSDYDCCGGGFSYYVCLDCNQFTEGCDSFFKCNTFIESEEEIDEEDYYYCLWKEVCPDCGLTLIEEEIENYSGCYESYYERIAIELNGVVIWEIIEEDNYADHSINEPNPEDIVMLGTTCDEGYKVPVKCEDCDLTFNMYAIGHMYSTDSFELPEDITCGGEYEQEVCDICGALGKVEYVDLNCDLPTPETSEYEDSDGILHMTATSTCPDCGLVFNADGYQVEDGCITTYYSSQKYIFNGETLFELSNSFKEDNHDLEVSYELIGDTCNDGLLVKQNCNNCDFEFESTSWMGHQTNGQYAQFDGCCGGSLYYEYCTVCEQVVYVQNYDHYFYKSSDEVITEENGIITSTYSNYCNNCDLIMKVTYIYSPIDEEYCVYEVTRIVEYIVDDQVILTYTEDDGTEHRHKLNVKFELLGTTCEDGYAEIEYCTECGIIDDISFYDEHDSEDVLLDKINLADYNACEGYIQLSTCACGYLTYIYDWEFACDTEYTEREYTDEEGNLHQYEETVCSECGLKIVYDYYDVVDGCYTYSYSILDVSINDTKIIDNLKMLEEVESDHIMVAEFDEGIDCQLNDYNVYLHCANCDYQYVDYDKYCHPYLVYYEVIETECGPMIIKTYSCASGNHVKSELEYECEDFDLESEEIEDEYGIHHSIREYTCKECGVVIIQDFYQEDNLCSTNNYCYITVKQNDQVVYEHEIIASVEVEHDINITYEFLDGENCENGVIWHYQCNNCDYGYDREYEYHYTQYQSISLSDFGACYGNIEVRNCACGHENHYNLHCCYDSYHTNVEIGEDGLEHTFVVRTCTNCGLRYTTEYYSVWDQENCKETTYYTVNLIIKGIHIINNYTYEETYDRHDLDVQYEMQGATCEDGVIVYERCKQCDYTNNDNYSYHRIVEDEVIDLTSMGCACPTEFIISSCLCGEKIEYEHNGECDFYQDYDWYYGENTDFFGRTVYDIYVYTFTCAATDPQCGFTYRVIHYYEKENINSCLAERYCLLQLGYNEDDGTCILDYTYKTDSTRYYHDDHEDVIEGTWEGGKTTEYISGCYNGCYEETRLYKYDEYENLVFEEINTYNLLENSSHRNITEYIRIEDINGSDVSYQCIYSYYENIYSSYSEYSEYQYSYNYPSECTRNVIYNNSYNDSYSDVEEYHIFTSDYYEPSTCSQSGYHRHYCDLCESIVSEDEVYPDDHYWVELEEGHYYCAKCGIENSNGTSGAIIIEDFTDRIGNGEYYVVGYYNPEYLQINFNVSIVLYEDEQMFIINPALHEVSDFVGFAILKSEVYELAEALGYAYGEYYVMIELVPVGYESDFVYGIGFDTKESEYYYDVYNREDLTAGESFAFEIATNQACNLTLEFVSRYDLKIELYEYMEEDESYLLIDSVSYTNYITCNLEEGKVYRFEISFVEETYAGYVFFKVIYFEIFLLDNFEISNGETKSIEVTPEVSGYYEFYSLAEDDTYGYLYLNDELLVSDDDGGHDYNFSLFYYLEAGVTYRIEVRFYSGGSSGIIPVYYVYSA